VTVADEREILRLFVSQPVAGRPDEDVFGERAEARDRVQAAYPDRHVALIGSFLSETPEGAHPPLWYLGASLQLMSGADLAYFCRGWEDARGCKVEFECAEAYEIPMTFYDEIEGE
jgi:hypothetical protein